MITAQILQKVPSLSRIREGMFQLFILHTSASLTINENADPDVRRDMEASLNHIVQENEPFYVHTLEGPDDMPAHIKASLLGSQVLIPIDNGKLALGTWQGIYLCEHRNYPGPRSFIISLWGEKSARNFV